MISSQPARSPSVCSLSFSDRNENIYNSSTYSPLNSSKNILCTVRPNEGTWNKKVFDGNVDSLIFLPSLGCIATCSQRSNSVSFLNVDTLSTIYTIKTKYTVGVNIIFYISSMGLLVCSGGNIDEIIETSENGESENSTVEENKNFVDNYEINKQRSGKDNNYSLSTPLRKKSEDIVERKEEKPEDDFLHSIKLINVNSMNLIAVLFGHTRVITSFAYDEKNRFYFFFFFLYIICLICSRLLWK
jgi:hypothetical protein